VWQSIVDWRQKSQVAPSPQQAQALGQQAFASATRQVTSACSSGPTACWCTAKAWAEMDNTIPTAGC
jgi:hypothetical protein